MKVATLALTAVISILNLSDVSAAVATPETRACVDFSGKYSGIGTETDSTGYLGHVAMHIDVTQTGCENLVIDEDLSDFIYRRTFVTDGRIHVREDRIPGKINGYHHEAAQFDASGLNIHRIKNYFPTKSLSTISERWTLDANRDLKIESLTLEGSRGLVKKTYQLKRY